MERHRRFQSGSHRSLAVTQWRMRLSTMAQSLVLRAFVPVIRHAALPAIIFLIRWRLRFPVVG